MHQIIEYHDIHMVKIKLNKPYVNSVGCEIAAAASERVMPNDVYGYHTLHNPAPS